MQGTYPHNLFVTALVGRAKMLTDAETRYWMGKTLLALGKTEEAKTTWREGASQIGAKDPAHHFIPVTATQEEYVKRCATAFDLSNIKH